MMLFVPSMTKLIVMPCDNPYYVKNPTYPYDLSGDREVPVPCGRCPLCLRRRVNQWIFRLQQEFKVSLNGFFVTLTYDNLTIPLTKKGWMTLHRPHVREFYQNMRDYMRRDGIAPTVKYYT